MRVLVCGGRKFSDYQLLAQTLDALHCQRAFSLLIHGAARGADTLAHEWAEKNGVLINWYRADWNKYKKAAGPILNTRMLTDGKPQLVVAFEGGDGTADMIEQARAAGVTVKVIE